MNTENFFYWLQGYFELLPEGGLSPTQAECVVRHADLVIHTKQAGSPSSMSKLYELRAFASMLHRVAIDFDRASIVATMRAIVSEEFEHTIDPKAGDAEHRAALAKIHHPALSGRPPVVLC